MNKIKKDTNKTFINTSHPELMTYNINYIQDHMIEFKKGQLPCKNTEIEIGDNGIKIIKKNNKCAMYLYTKNKDINILSGMQFCPDMDFGTTESTRKLCVLCSITKTIKKYYEYLRLGDCPAEEIIQEFGISIIGNKMGIRDHHMIGNTSVFKGLILPFLCIGKQNVKPFITKSGTKKLQIIFKEGF